MLPTKIAFGIGRLTSRSVLSACRGFYWRPFSVLTQPQTDNQQLSSTQQPENISQKHHANTHQHNPSKKHNQQSDRKTPTAEVGETDPISFWPHRTARYGPVSSFHELGINEKLCTALEAMGITAPTPVQAASIQQILKGEDVIVRGQTGCGKTLGILVAVLHATRKSPKNGTHTLIVVPTRELGWQIARWIMSLKSLGDKYSSFVCLAVSGVDLAQQTEQLKSVAPQILVGTPKRIIELMEQGALDFTHLKTLVIDEVDHIIQPVSSYATAKKIKNRENHPKPGVVLIDEIKKLGADVQNTIVASATVNHNTKRELQSRKWLRYYGSVLVDVGSPFTLPPTINHYQVEVKGENDAADMEAALVQAVETLKVKAGLVFIESTGSVSGLVNRVKLMGLSIGGLSGVMDFSDISSAHALDDFTQGRLTLLAATEFTARGLDFPIVDTVFILGAFFTPNSYLHMAGRTARMGRAGNVVTIFPHALRSKCNNALKFVELPFNPQPSIQINTQQQ